MNITPATPVRQLVDDIPDAQQVLRDLKIDYVNRAADSLADACAVAGTDLDDAIAMLRVACAYNGGPTVEEWKKKDLFELTRHIVDHHHLFTREALFNLETAAAELYHEHRSHAPEIEKIWQSLAGFKSRMTRHMLEEEQVLFPYIERLEAASHSDAPIQPPFFETIRSPVNRLVVEHGESLEQIEAILEFRELRLLPAECQAAFAAFFDRVEELASDLYAHAYLENNILLPRAVELEASLEPRFFELGELW